jgi:hypothetical protein
LPISSMDGCIEGSMRRGVARRKRAGRWFGLCEDAGPGRNDAKNCAICAGTLHQCHATYRYSKRRMQFRSVLRTRGPCSIFTPTSRTTSQSRSALGSTTNGKPGESRRRKAPRLRCPRHLAGRAAEWTGPRATSPRCRAAGIRAGTSVPSIRCSEQSHRKVATQSSGATATSSPCRPSRQRIGTSRWRPTLVGPAAGGSEP